MPPFWTVGQTIDFMREEPRLPEEFTELYVVDPGFRFLGTVPLDKLLRSKRPTRIEEIISEAKHSVEASDDQEDVARLFERYNLLSVGVVDDAGRLVGVITIDDIVDIIEEEADEDIKRLAGVGDEEISEGVFQIVRLRSSWLLVNLLTAFLSASVISLFEATIERIAILAMLFPIVAGLGGNAGTQTLTVTVRALATQQLNPGNTWRLIGREALVGICNGVVLGFITGVLVGADILAARTRPGHRRRHAGQPDGRRARWHHRPAGSRPGQHRPCDRFQRLRHRHDGRDRLLRLPCARHMAADVIGGARPQPAVALSAPKRSSLHESRPTLCGPTLMIRAPLSQLVAAVLVSLVLASCGGAAMNEKLRADSDPHPGRRARPCAAGAGHRHLQIPGRHRLGEGAQGRDPLRLPEGLRGRRPRRRPVL